MTYVPHVISFDEALESVDWFMEEAAKDESGERPFLAYWFKYDLFELVGFTTGNDGETCGFQDDFVTVEDGMELVRQRGLSITMVGKHTDGRT
jgi:hypothetical protein